MLCRELGTGLSCAAAIGDSENDLEMLRAVALPIAMGNANDAVKAICKRETLTNAEDGVAAAIDRHSCREPGKILPQGSVCAKNSGIQRADML